MPLQPPACWTAKTPRPRRDTQESGRAARDGLPARSVVYFSADDASLSRFILNKSAGTMPQNSNLSRRLAALDQVLFCVPQAPEHARPRAALTRPCDSQVPLRYSQVPLRWMSSSAPPIVCQPCVLSRCALLTKEHAACWNAVGTRAQ
eukprot:1713648-Pleurochrysis_carterae.AAC.3